MTKLFKHTVLLSMLLLIPGAALTAQDPPKPGKKVFIKIVDSTEVKQLKAQIVELEEKVAKLEKEIEILEPVRDQWADHLATSLVGKWDNVPLGDLDVASMDEDIALCDQFSPYKAELGLIAVSLKQIRDWVDLVKLGDMLVHESYNKEVVDDVTPKVEQLLADLRNEKKDKAVVDPVRELYQQLSSYSLALSVFQDLIAEVDKQLAKFHSSEPAARNAASAVIDQKEASEEAVSCICQVPWLETQFKAYRKALERSPLKPNATRDLIMDLKP